MDHVDHLDRGLAELRGVVTSLDESDMSAISNCAPWSVRQLASHALNNQLFWAGLVAGEQLVSFEDAMAAVPIDGDLAPVADEVATQAAALWRTDGILDAMHVTPLGEVPGSVVAYFATVDSMAHAWDLSASVGRPIEFGTDTIPWMTEVVAATCNDVARDHGLIQAATQPPADATDTERLMAAAGRRIPRPA
jgi:uncharacterized protein (TIGR03086 family)